MGSLEIYKAILKEAQAGGLLEQIPDDKNAIEEEGKFFYEEASKAIASGNKDKVAKAIVNLGNSIGKNEELFGSDKELFRGLPVPKVIDREASDVPHDLTSLTDKEIRKLHGEYGAYLARGRWQLSVAINKHGESVVLKNNEYRKAYIKITNELETEGRRATKDLVDAMIGQSKEYAQAESAEKAFERDVVAYKGLVEVYSGYVDRLSREWTMRIDEDKRSH